MRAFEFLTEKSQDKADLAAVQQKLQYIQDTLLGGEVDDPKTIDYIYKILNKPQIQQTIEALVGKISEKDKDVLAFNQQNQGILNKIIRKMSVSKEELDAFLEKWSSGTGLVNTKLIVPGNAGSINDLIPDATAYAAFEVFEKLKSVYKMPKKGTTGYGEFGLSMLSSEIRMKAPGDIEVNNKPIEVKGNNARLYADERSKPTSESLEEAPKKPIVPTAGAPTEEPAAAPAPKAKRGSEPGLLNNIVASLQLDPTVPGNKEIIDRTVSEVIAAFKARGADATAVIASVQNSRDPGVGFNLLSVEWWKASFSAYQKTINMPIMVLGFNKFYISSKAQDFVDWGCLPKTPSTFGYMFGRQAGQPRETYPKIFVPGHNI
jgi:hypothetical protein